MLKLEMGKNPYDQGSVGFGCFAVTKSKRSVLVRFYVGSKSVHAISKKPCCLTIEYVKV